jgi:hypothetical protein
MEAGGPPRPVLRHRPRANRGRWAGRGPCPAGKVGRQERSPKGPFGDGKPIFRRGLI